MERKTFNRLELEYLISDWESWEELAEDEPKPLDIDNWAFDSEKIIYTSLEDGYQNVELIFRNSKGDRFYRIAATISDCEGYTTTVEDILEEVEPYAVTVIEYRLKSHNGQDKGILPNESSIEQLPGESMEP